MLVSKYNFRILRTWAKYFTYCLLVGGNGIETRELIALYISEVPEDLKVSSFFANNIKVQN